MTRNFHWSLSLILGLAFSACSDDDNSSSGGSSAGSGKLYVSGSAGNKLLRFGSASTVDGNTAPEAVIAGNLTTLNSPSLLFLDIANDRLYVANSGANAILVFNSASTISGNIAPSRTITLSPTATNPLDVALNSTSDEMYVADAGNDYIRVYQNASTISGSVSPSRTITSAFIGIGGIFLDVSGDRLYAVDTGNGAVHVFNSVGTKDGSYAPDRTISGANTQLTSPAAVRIGSNDELVVSCLSGSNSRIVVFANASTVNGNAVPARVLTGASTTLASPKQFALNADQILVANSVAGTIPVWGTFSSATGNLAPSRSIGGAATELSGAIPKGIAIDPTR